MAIVVNAVGATKYSFPDQKTGRMVEGVNVYYLQSKNTESAIGMIPQKVSLPLEHWGTVSMIKFPSDCEVITEQHLGAKGIYNKTVGIKPVEKKF